MSMTPVMANAITTMVGRIPKSRPKISDAQAQLLAFWKKEGLLCERSSDYNTGLWFAVRRQVAEYRPLIGCQMS